MAVLSSLQYARLRVRKGKTGQRVRLAAAITAGVGAVFNDTHPFANYARTSDRLASPYFAWSPYPTPPFEHDSAVPGAAGCTEARFCWSPRRAIVLLCNDDGAIVERVSDDDGYSFSAPVNRFTSAAHPDIAISRSGLILRAAYLSGALSITRQSPGDSSPGAAFNAKDSSAVDLSLTDDSFRIVADARGFWHLHVRLGAGASTSLLQSYDDGATWQITSGAVTGITSGTHPGMCAGADGSLFAYAHVAGKAHLSRRFPGDTAWSTPAAIDDDAGADLLIEDQPFSIAQAYEGSRRLVLAVIVDGESLVSEWGSADDGQSFKRLPTV